MNIQKCLNLAKNIHQRRAYVLLFIKHSVHTRLNNMNLTNLNEKQKQHNSFIKHDSNKPTPLPQRAIRKCFAPSCQIGLLERSSVVSV